MILARTAKIGVDGLSLVGISELNQSAQIQSGRVGKCYVSGRGQLVN